MGHAKVGRKSVSWVVDRLREKGVSTSNEAIEKAVKAHGIPYEVGQSCFTDESAQKLIDLLSIHTWHPAGQDASTSGVNTSDVKAPRRPRLVKGAWDFCPPLTQSSKEVITHAQARRRLGVAFLSDANDGGSHSSLFWYIVYKYEVPAEWVGGRGIVDSLELNAAIAQAKKDGVPDHSRRLMYIDSHRGEPTTPIPAPSPAPMPTPLPVPVVHCIPAAKDFATQYEDILHARLAAGTITKEEFLSRLERFCKA